MKKDYGSGNLFGEGGGEEPPECDTRADQIYRRFCEFHLANFRVWKLFERFTFEMIAAGRVKFSAYAIMERIRWFDAVETRGEPVKINDHYTPYYARMFVAVHPQHAGIFEFRARLSADRPAFENDIPVFHTGDAGDESDLMANLREMAKEKK